MMSLSRASLESVDTEKGEGKGTEWRPEWRPESKREIKENLKDRQSQKFATLTSAAGLWRKEAPRADVGALPFGARSSLRDDGS